MGVGVGIGIAVIAFLQVAILSGAAYFALAKLAQGKARIFLSAIIPGAYLLGRYQQAFQEDGWPMEHSGEVITIVITQVLSLAFLTFGAINMQKRSLKRNA